MCKKDISIGILNQISKSIKQIGAPGIAVTVTPYKAQPSSS